VYTAGPAHFFFREKKWAKETRRFNRQRWLRPESRQPSTFFREKYETYMRLFPRLYSIIQKTIFEKGAGIAARWPEKVRCAQDFDLSHICLFLFQKYGFLEFPSI
jgi:hypothetical protein